MTGYVSRRFVYCVVDSVVVGERVKPVQEAVRRVLYRYRVRDPGFFNRVSGIVYNVFRNYGLVDYIVWKTLGVDVYSLRATERALLRIVGYTWFLDRVLDRRSRVRFYRYCLGYVKERYRRGLGRIDKLLEKLVSSSWSPSDWYEEIMYRYRVGLELYRALENAFRELGEDLHSFLEYTLTPPPYHVFRVNTLKADPDAIYEHLKSLGLRVEKGRYSRRALRVYGSLSNEVIRFIETGILVPQDESSIVAIELLPLQPGVVVADLCAAPGGKTSLVAEVTRLESTIHAFDINRDRVKRMHVLLDRTGVDRVVRVYNMDARRALEVLSDESVDVAIVDPPCSSTGALARNPDVRWRYRECEIKSIVDLQKQLLEIAYRIVKKRGYILYTTCSVLPVEGEYVVKHLLDRYRCLEIVSLEKPFNRSPLLEGTMRAYPHRHGVIGFYYALLRKR